MTGSAVKDGWTLADAPDQTGKVAIVTGATGGLGFEVALGLARLGATTVLAGRDAKKGALAVARILMMLPDAAVRFESLDLAGLASVASFAARTEAAHGGIVDILVNNAGVMAFPVRHVTADGFEQQIGVNYLAHFALTAWLKKALCAGSGGGRVLNVASLAHRRAAPGLQDFQSEQSYRPMQAYGRSKLAMLVFALELQRRTERFGWNLRAVAAHPGWARTAIIGNGIGGGAPDLKSRTIDAAFALVAQSARAGALPLLYAAVAPEAAGGGYYGPADWGETRGAVAASRIFPQAADPAAGAALWALSERLTGATFG